MATDMFQPGSCSVIPATLVELSVSCRKLIDADVFSKSDPMCVLFTQDPGSKKWTEFGRTEIIWNNLNPEFVKKFIIHYFFEECQKLKFEIYDVDSKSAKLDKHDFLGKLECTLAEIVIANRFVKPLRAFDGEFGELGQRQDGGPKRDSGVIIINAEELSSCKEVATMQFSAHQLDKKDFFGKSDPFLTFYRCNEDGSFTVVHRTEVIKRTLNPTWRTFTINIRLLCNGDYERPIKVECYDWDADGGHDLIGIFQTTLRELSKGREISNVYECINPKKKAKKKKYRNSGTVELLSCSVDKVFTFLDYIRGGTQIHCTFAIDFTASNGNPTSPSSLHYISPYNLNPYATALNAVGHIIQDYDTDQLFPALGFGARLPPNGVVSHEFALNGNPENPYCHGVQGVVAAYHKTLHSVQLYGPTNFSPCINHIARFAALQREGNDYFILLILTDGIITDMPQTMEAIVNEIKIIKKCRNMVLISKQEQWTKSNQSGSFDVYMGSLDSAELTDLVGLYILYNLTKYIKTEDIRLYRASKLPMSIIIIGIGDADFEAMEILDGDDVRVSSRGRYAERDIVQFVPMRNFMIGNQGDSSLTLQARLAKEVLEEIPEQFLSYMKKQNVRPKPPLLRQQTISSITSLPASEQ